MTATPEISKTSTILAPGVEVRRVAKVNSSSQVAELLGEATAGRTSVIPFAGCRSVATGHPIGEADLGLDLTALSGLIAYEPADLTLSVLAGTTLAEIQSELGKHGQEIPIDSPSPERATIGGLVATGFAGPRRLRSGSLRDLLIGCEYVRGDGLLAKAGGMVVKNVSGFEIPRFLHGSWGALAVLASVNLKVTPRPRADGTVVSPCADVATGVAAALDLIASEPTVESCVVVRGADGTHVVARAVGRSAAVKETLDSFSARLGPASAHLHGESSTGFWQGHVDRFAEDPDCIVLAFNIRPREIVSFAKVVDQQIGNVERAELAVSPGTGSIRLRYPHGGGGDVALLSTLAALAPLHGASYVLESAPPSLRSAIPAWGAPPEGIDVMRSVKREFDPAGILNPGRLFV
jgi:glycolate oxidase FAD binding subunit